MNKELRKRILFFSVVFLTSVNLRAQFTTLRPEPKQAFRIIESKTKVTDSVKVAEQDSLSIAHFIENDKNLRQNELEIDIPSNDKVMNTLLLDIFTRRMKLCRPLDNLYVTSTYGFRPDPFTGKRTFHDGTDFRCNQGYVYAMLPGKVIETGSKKKGYGNYVVLEHGNIRVLYGHLSSVLVRKGKEVSAGQIVAISGNTGKSTGPHLHIRITKDGKSVDPMSFLSAIEKAIDKCDMQLRAWRIKQYGTDVDMESSSLPLNIPNLLSEINRNGIKHPEIVLAQGILETGWFTSRVCREDNNLFGLRRPSDGSYFHFNHWTESVKAYYDKVQYKYHGGNYLNWLRKIGYAEDPNYIDKLCQVMKELY